MGFLDTIESALGFSSSSSAPADGGTHDQRVQYARNALVYYHNYAAQNYPQNYTIASLDDLMNRLEGIVPGFTDLFGKTVIEATDLTQSDIETAMESVARGSQGLPPTQASDLTAFYDALAGKLLNWDWSHWGTVVAQSTVQAVGQVTSIATMGLATYLLIGVIVFAVVAAKK